MAANKKERVATHPALSCGAEGEHKGAVVGCCFECGLLLCEGHVFHRTADRRFGQVGKAGVQPLVCGAHAGPLGRPGLPLPPTAPTPTVPKRGIVALLPQRQPKTARGSRRRG